MTEDNRKVILIVDDDDITREMYMELFKSNNFQVIEARDGIEGLDIATSHEGIDVIFTGVIMPRMDGFQLMSALKENTMTASIPVVINSHLGREEDRKKAMELGAKDFIIRGIISPAEVVKKVIQAFSLVGKDYLLKVDPYDQDAQAFILDMALPEELLCNNCGYSLAVKVSGKKGNDLTAKVMCPNCKVQY